MGGVQGGEARKQQMAEGAGGDVHAAYSDMGTKVTTAFCNAVVSFVRCYYLGTAAPEGQPNFPSAAAVMWGRRDQRGLAAAAASSVLKLYILVHIAQQVQQRRDGSILFKHVCLAL